MQAVRHTGHNDTAMTGTIFALKKLIRITRYHGRPRLMAMDFVDNHTVRIVQRASGPHGSSCAVETQTVSGKQAG